MSRRASAPPTEVPFLTDKVIEEESALLLAEFCAQQRPIMAPPIPIDDIIELHLKLTFEISDLQGLFRVADVHGAIWINDGRLAVDQSLDPDRNPRKLGRYRFTLGHETGHWRLHRTHYLNNEAQRALFDKQSDAPAYICRSNQKPRVEQQADRFSAFLLMPRSMVLKAWEQHRGSLDPMSLDDLRAKESEIIAAESSRRGRLNTDRESLDNAMLDWYGLPLAKLFEVSPEAMRIRLETLKLLVRKKDRSLFE
jgi:Zn-dependent peptidase ImmA (M78 family)